MEITWTKFQFPSPLKMYVKINQSFKLSTITLFDVPEITFILYHRQFW